MYVYVFGNASIAFDNAALTVAQTIGGSVPGIDFITVEPNENLPFADKQDVVLMDVVQGLTKVRLFAAADISKLLLPPRTTAHDFDLGFQLNYLKKLGKLGRVTLIGLPMYGQLDYNRIHSIFKKLVAQDIHGS
jgi:hypothetical protein